MIKAICRTDNYFNGILYKASQRHEFPDGTKLPRHFEILEAPKPPEPKENGNGELTKAQLIELARVRGIELPSRTTKAQIIEALEAESLEVELPEDEPPEE